MIGALPDSVIPSVTAKDPYRVRVIMDDTMDCDLQHGVGMVYDVTPGSPVKVKRPTEDSLPAPRCVIFPGSTFPHDTTALLEAADFSLDTKPVLAAMDASSAAPTLGCTVGTVAGSWGLKKDNTGFVVCGIVNTSPYVVYVRPAGSGGGGSATLLIVQATGNGSAGVIAAKTMTLKSDPSASPNYDLAASAVNYNYFKA